jgi:hypothetical protein
MTSIWLLQCARIVSALSILHVNAVGQTPLEPQKLRRKYEDEVARLFETLRAKHELPTLTRIIHRQALEELVCSSAALDTAVWGENSPGAVMYKTSDPATTHTELERIARFKDPLQGKNQPSFTRYAVAVWQTSRGGAGSTVYWVGIQIYMSAWWEFIDNNFTDNRANKDDWKKLVTPACRGVD